MCVGMDCIREVPKGCPIINGSLEGTKQALQKVALAAADLSENCCSHKGMEDSTSGMVIIHDGCPCVIAANKRK
jgi:hypothetical protein